MHSLTLPGVEDRAPAGRLLHQVGGASPSKAVPKHDAEESDIPIAECFLLPEAPSGPLLRPFYQKPEPFIRFYGVILGLLISAVCAWSGVVEDYASKVAPLIDPAKLATLGHREANPRVQKAVYWLAVGRADLADPAKVVDVALHSLCLMNNAGTEMTKGAPLRNLTIAERLGCLDADGLAEMRKGHAATVRCGPYSGDQLSVDHIIPRAMVPELDNVIANLELMPLRANQLKSAKVWQRQRDLAGKLNKAGLLSDAGMKSVLGHR